LCEIDAHRFALAIRLGLSTRASLDHADCPLYIGYLPSQIKSHLFGASSHTFIHAVQLLSDSAHCLFRKLIQPSLRPMLVGDRFR
jgi:hypothetical protein